MLDALRELWAELPQIEERLRALLPWHPESRAWLWISAAISFIVLTTAVGGALGWLATTAYNWLSRRQNFKLRHYRRCQPLDDPRGICIF